MKPIQRRGCGLVGVLLLVGAALTTASAKAPETSTAAGDEALLERRLQAAQQRLEQAAKEVAELTAGFGAGQAKELRIHVGEPRAMLGVQLGEPRSGGGVRVVGVTPGGPAAEAGLKSGDVILSVNGERAGDAADVSRAVQQLRPGAGAQLEVERGGKFERLVVVTRRYDPRAILLGACLAESYGGVTDSWPWVGGSGELELAPLSPGLGRYFGTDRGVLVVRAPADGSFKLQDGDVITAIGGHEPQSASHALSILRSYPPGEHLAITIRRDHKPLVLELSVPAWPQLEDHAPPWPSPGPPAPASPPRAGAA
jgi:S1-C subfamily serine protease